MLVKKFGEYLLVKDANAIAIAFLCALLPVFGLPTGFIAGIIVGLITLQKGARPGLILLAWVALPAIAMLVLRKVGQSDALLLRCFLVWCFAMLLRQYKRCSLLSAIAIVFGVVFVLLLNHFVPHLQQWWTKQLTIFVKQYIAESHEKLGMTPIEFAKKIAPMATALATFFFLLGLFLQLMVARCWQISLFRKK